MSFSAAQYQEVTSKLTTGLRDLSARTEEIRPEARSAADQWHVPDAIADAFLWTADKLYAIGKWLAETIADLTRGIAAPVTFLFTANDWQNDVHRNATEVAGEIQPKTLMAPRKWKGEGADAYTAAVWPQPAAAAQIGKIADSVAAALVASAVAGLLFYLALAAIVVKLIAAMTAAIAAFGTGVFSWAGLAITLEEAAVDSAMVWGAITTLGGALATQTERFVALASDTQDHAAFPRGHWPDPSPS